MEKEKYRETTIKLVMKDHKVRFYDGRSLPYIYERDGAYYLRMSLDSDDPLTTRYFHMDDYDMSAVDEALAKRVTDTLRDLKVPSDMSDDYLPEVENTRVYYSTDLRDTYYNDPEARFEVEEVEDMKWYLFVFRLGKKKQDEASNEESGLPDGVLSVEDKKMQKKTPKETGGSKRSDSDREDDEEEEEEEEEKEHHERKEKEHHERKEKDEGCQTKKRKADAIEKKNTKEA